MKISQYGRLCSLASFSSSAMQILFGQGFWVYTKSLRVYLLLRLAKFYLLKFPVWPEVKQLAKSSQPAAVKWYFWRKSWMGPARELQAAAWINPGCLSAASAAHPLSSGQLGKNSRTATPTAQNSQWEQWGFLISTCPLSQKGIKCALTKFTFPSILSWTLRWMRNGTCTVHASPSSKCLWLCSAIWQ